jgi:hypothetical protein
VPTNILLVDEKLKRDGHIFFCWRFMYLKKKGRTEKKNISTKYKIFLLARREFGYIFREKIAPSIYLSCNKKEFRFSFFFICLDVCFQAGLSTLTRCTCVCTERHGIQAMQMLIQVSDRYFSSGLFIFQFFLFSPFTAPIYYCCCPPISFSGIVDRYTSWVIFIEMAMSLRVGAQ